ncbi:hypothetical protein Cba03nite_45010 [Catellatospora bangladeshensis]|uniref:LamG-like jellyroll fold domain-containing protein n=1 Tax=Catellatospora bangladeshensis TaxID=310355 RepID=A0A8J3JM68_9ACTN|nr:hypothetical protein Cba03nite_45010 [Catellatospora bangladeshensis]
MDGSSQGFLSTRRSVRVLLTVALLAFGVVVPSAAASVAEPSPVCAPAALTEAAAVKMAAECGTSVAVEASRTEYTQVVATASGVMRLESAAVPVRARTGTGSWAPIDLTLSASAHGDVRPAVSSADVRFSAGGPNPLVTLVRAGHRFELSWPAALPAPVLDGDSATYQEVLPDVDLVARATRTGFTHVLVIKSAAAADSEAVRSVRFEVSGDAVVQQFGDGSLRAVTPDGQLMADAHLPLMWDSGTSVPRSGLPQGREALTGDDGPGQVGVESSHVGAGDGAQVAAVGTEITAAGDLMLVPDEQLLSSATFPLYVDPAWDEDRNRWAYSTDNGSSNSDYTSARVGRNPDTGTLFRSYFEFPMTDSGGVTLKGKQIKTARVQMTLDHSWSCGDTWTHMYLTSTIDKTMRATWSKMPLTKWLASAEGHANEDDGCGAPDPDMTMNFMDTAPGGVLLTQVQAAAKASLNTFTVAFCACNSQGQYESSQDRWKRFDPAEAFLVVEYNTAPTAPTDLRFGTFTCPAVAALADPPEVGSVSTTLEALANDADGGTADVTFRWVQIPPGTTDPDLLTGYTDVTFEDKTVNSKPAGQAPNASRVQSALNGLTEGKTYGFKVKSQDPNTVATYSPDSPWSQWCVFAVDVSIPDPPGVSSVNCPEEQLTTVGPGQTCNVVMTTTATDAAYFEYWFEGQSRRMIPVDADLQVEVPVTPIRYGLNTFNVFVVDSVGHPSASETTYSFYVAAPSKPVAHWNLEQFPPAFAAAEALHDQQGTATDLTFNGTWAADTRLIGARTATFNGSSHSASTSGPVVSTSGSFSVSAWVRLSALPTDDMIAVTQAGADAAGFQLGVKMLGTPLTPRWAFIMKDTQAQSSATRTAGSPVALTSADLGQWIHIAGVYDTNAKKIRLYVNGVLTGGTDRTAAPWPSTGNFAVGRGFAGGVSNKWWNGSIADVRAWDRALVAEDFTPQPVSGDVGLVDHDVAASWSFDAISLCLPTVCPRLTDDSTFTRQLQLELGTLTGPDQSQANEICQVGGRNTVALFDTCDIDYNEPGSSGPEFGTVIKNHGTEGAPDWRHAPVVRTDTSFTVSAWVRPQEDSLLTGCRTALAQDATVAGGPVSGFYLRSCTSPQTGGGTAARWEFYMPDTGTATTNGVSVTSLLPIASSADATVGAETAGRWTFLTAVYDGASREMRLYVNGVLQGSVQRPAGSAWHAAGALTIGRARWSDTPNPAGFNTDFYLGAVDQVSVYAGVLDQTAIDQAYTTEGLDGATPE